MSRELLQQALDALEFPHDSEWSNKAKAIEALQHALTQPEQATVLFPSFMRKRIEEAIDSAINPKGMSVHDGKATVYASDLQRMIAVIDLAPPRQELAKPQQEPVKCTCGYAIGHPLVTSCSCKPRKPWIGLTDDEIEEAWGNTPMMLNARDGSSRKMFACTIQAKLKELNT